MQINTYKGCSLNHKSSKQTYLSILILPVLQIRKIPGRCCFFPRIVFHECSYKCWNCYHFSKWSRFRYYLNYRICLNSTYPRQLIPRIIRSPIIGIGLYLTLDTPRPIFWRTTWVRKQFSPGDNAIDESSK